MGTILLYGAIHIAWQQTSKELFADTNLLAQCELTHSNFEDATAKGPFILNE